MANAYALPAKELPRGEKGRPHKSANNPGQTEPTKPSSSLYLEGFVVCSTSDQPFRVVRVATTLDRIPLGVVISYQIG